MLNPLNLLNPLNMIHDMKKQYLAPQSENVLLDPIMDNMIVNGSPVNDAGAESPLRNFSGAITPVRYI